MAIFYGLRHEHEVGVALLKGEWAQGPTTDLAAKHLGFSSREISLQVPGAPLGRNGEVLLWLAISHS